MIAEVGAEAAAMLAALHARAFPRGWSAEELLKLLENPAAFALADGQGHGFVLAWVVGDEAEILTLAVVPEARRRGLGAALVLEASHLVHRRGAATLHLEVGEDNPAARALYAKLGFAEAGVRPGYYAGGAVNAIVMRRALPISPLAVDSARVEGVLARPKE